jgi:hypothetical protein
MSVLCLEWAVSRLKYIPLRAPTQFFEHFCSKSCLSSLSIHQNYADTQVIFSKAKYLHSLWRVETFSGLCERGVARCEVLTAMALMIQVRWNVMMG